tara:strand:- start:709 stop:960 length:252 start_codon:yes stop_codon:yes gene_type:complete
MTTESEVREEPVLVLNDKKYLISELSDEAKAFVVEINLVDQETNQARRTLDRLVLAKEGYTTRLQQILEAEPDTDDTNEEPAN